MTILKIDRSSSLEHFSEKEGWSIVEQDERSLEFTEINVTKLRLRTTLHDNEKEISGEEDLVRSKASGEIRLDAAIFKMLLDNEFDQEILQTKKPGHLQAHFETWYKTEKPSSAFSFKEDGTVLNGIVFFNGTVFLSPEGKRCVLCMYWRNGECNYGYADLSQIKWTRASPHVFIES